MATKVFMAMDGDNDAQRLDNINLYTDDAAVDGTGGNTYTGEFTTIEDNISADNPGGFGFIGDFEVNVHQTTGAVITVTPVTDRVERTAKAIARTKVAGDSLKTRFPFHTDASQFKLKTVISAFDQEVGVGVGEIWKLPSRIHG